jgi:hypothetical protein
VDPIQSRLLINPGLVPLIGKSPLSNGDRKVLAHFVPINDLTHLLANLLFLQRGLGSTRYFFGNPAQLHQVLINLLTNAARYTIKGGEVVIRLASTELADQLRTEQAEMAKLNLEIAQKEKQLEKEKTDLTGEISVTGIQRELADVYAARDETIFPRNKIIEDAIDLNYQNIREQHSRGNASNSKSALRRNCSSSNPRSAPTW